MAKRKAHRRKSSGIGHHTRTTTIQIPINGRQQAWNKGRPHPPQTRQKISQSMLRYWLTIPAEEKTIRMTKWHSNPEKWRILLSVAGTGRPPTLSMLGKHHSEVTKKKIAEKSRAAAISMWNDPEIRARIITGMRARAKRARKPQY